MPTRSAICRVVVAARPWLTKSPAAASSISSRGGTSALLAGRSRGRPARRCSAAPASLPPTGPRASATPAIISDRPASADPPAPAAEARDVGRSPHRRRLAQESQHVMAVVQPDPADRHGDGQPGHEASETGGGQPPYLAPAPRPRPPRGGCPPTDP